MNYTSEQTEKLHQEYDGTMDSVRKLADELGKSPKSIIGKLAKEGIYRKEQYKTKSGEDPVTKMELQAQIEDCCGFDRDDLEGLHKSPKLVLKRLAEFLEEEMT